MASTSDDDIIELTDIINLDDIVDNAGEYNAPIKKQKPPSNDNDDDDEIDDDINAILSQMEDDDDNDLPSHQFNANETIDMPDMSEVNDLLNDLNIPSQNDTNNNLSKYSNNDDLDNILDDLLGATNVKSIPKPEIANDFNANFDNTLGTFDPTDEETDLFNIEVDPAKPLINSEKRELEGDKNSSNTTKAPDIIDSLSTEHKLADNSNSLDDMLEINKLLSEDIDSLHDSNPKSTDDEIDVASLLNELPNDENDELNLGIINTSNDAKQDDDKLLANLLKRSVNEEIDSILNLAELEVASSKLQINDTINLNEQTAKDAKTFDQELSKVDNDINKEDLTHSSSMENTNIGSNSDASPMDSQSTNISNIPPIIPAQSNDNIKELENNIQTLETRLEELSQSNSELQERCTSLEENSKVNELENNIQTLETRLEELSQSNSELQERCTSLTDNVISLKEEFTTNVEKAAAAAAAKVIREEIAKLLA